MSDIKIGNIMDMPPKTWTLSLSEPWLSLMKSGHKVYEGRLFRGLPRYFKVGDRIEFYPDEGTDDQPVTMRITSMNKYQTFRESLEKLPIGEVLPNIKTVDEGEKIYFQYASKDSQTKWGVCQIGVCLCDDPLFSE